MQSIIVAFLCFLSISAYCGESKVAKATVTVVNGFVVDATVTDPGAGYFRSPTVTIIGGGGSGAVARAVISPQGQVTELVIENAGRGYTNKPSVVFTEPQWIGLHGIVTAPVLVITNAAGLRVQVSYSDNVDSTQWNLLTNLWVESNQAIFVDMAAIGKPKRFYKVTPRAEGTGYAPLEVSNYFVRIQLNGGPFAPASYDLDLFGGNTGIFELKNGSEGHGNYTYSSNGNTATLILNYINPAGGDQDVMNMVFNNETSGAFTGTQKVSGPGGTLTTYPNFAGTFTHLRPR
ncbi:MAG: hypothetical protein ACO1QB_16310 [Verrucomicrobiales bacterium]